MSERKVVSRKKEPFIPNLLALESEYLFKALGRESEHLTCEVRCLALVLILYVPGLIVTSITGSVTEFITKGWGFFLSNILIGLIVWLLISFLRKLNKRIENVSKIIAPEESETSKAIESLKQTTQNDQLSWGERKENYRKWVRRGFEEKVKWYHKWYYWYYSQALIVASLALLISKLAFVERIGWIQGSPFNELYFMTWFTFLGFLGGVVLYYIEFGFWVIRGYCKKVITEAEILPFDPDRTGGLKELGRLSLDLDLIVAVPSLAFLIYIPQNPDLLTEWGGKGILVALMGLYTLFLMFVFFISLSPAHDAMVTAKTKHLIDLHNEYRDIHSRLIHKLRTKGEELKPKDYNIVEGLYRLYDRVEGMSVWPLDYRIMLRFIITSVLPLITALVTISITAATVP
jgi:hypothetical protein